MSWLHRSMSVFPAFPSTLKVLERCGLISHGRLAQFRPCHLEVGALDAAADWIEESRRLWTERFDQLDEHLHAIQRTPPKNKKDKTPQ